MTGTNRFCVKSVLRTAVGLVLGTTAAIGQTRLPNDRSPLADGSFSAALSDELPQSRYGGYQHIDSRATSALDDGFQFADPGPDDSKSVDAFSGSDSEIWGHTDIRQTQYPLSDERFDDPLSAATGPSAQPFVPPTLRPSIPSSPVPNDGWALQADLQSDVTHVIGSGNTLGITTLTGRLVIETPRLPGVSVRPHVGWHLLNGPNRTDLPGQLYDASIEARMYWPFHDRIIGEFALAPSVFSDFQNTSGDALRIVGRGVGYFIWSPDVKLAAGATYLDRKDIQVLPIAGVIWTPTPDHRLELLFPQPRIARRYKQDAHHERWVYLSGEFGGGSWAIERSNGMDDVVSYRDWRLITGIEWKYHDKSSWRIEGGYVFGRQLEYVSGIGDYEPGNTSMIRAALVY